jgi:formate dehydrogenase gamma subunit
VIPTGIERHFPRFKIGQRWEHTILFLSILILLLTGIPQKYRTTEWSQVILSTPQRVATIQQIHHIAAVILAIVVVYHIGKAILQIIRRRLPGDILPTTRDVRDAWNMLLHLIFIKKNKPAFGKYNYEQKITYWFIFFSVAIMGATGLILWFPEVITRYLPGGIVPAAKLAHSSEAIVIVIFTVVWHFYHVHIERLNLSIFSGYLNESDMHNYHELEYRRIISEAEKISSQGDSL